MKVFFIKKDNSLKKILHVGCGSYGKVHQLFSNGEWQEIRLDIDPHANPDIINSITDMKGVASEGVDAVYSSHNLEHLYPHEVIIALKEFLRVLKPDGFCLLSVPDIEVAAKFIAEGKITEPIYTSPAGPVSPLDMIYGFRPSLANGNTFMAHKTGFTMESLGHEFMNSGFKWAKYAKDTAYSLWIKAYKNVPSESVKNESLW